MPDTIFTTPWDFAITCAVLVIAQLVYVMFGFGSGLIAVGGLALVFPEIKDVVVVLLLVNLPAELWVCWQSRRDISWRPIAILGVGIGLGIPLGAWILKQGDPRFILVILGWFLMAVGLVFLRLPSGGRHRPPAWLGPPTGLISGVLTGLFGTGGPPLIIWYHLAVGSKSAFRGNLMTIFLLMSVVRVPSYLIGGLITVPRLWSTLAVMPAVLFGAWLGHRLHIQLSEVVFRRMVAGLLFILGLVQVIR
nr:sulfite exporter TauE/SafE family protein [Candidatus Krumholzibacteria bacterium]